MTEKTIDKLNASRIPIPMCIVNQNGKIVSANKYIEEVFIYSGIQDGDFFALTGVKVANLLPESEDEIIIERNGKKFKLLVTMEDDTEESNFIVFFDDITNYEELKSLYQAEKTCVCRINIDNYEELMSTVEPEIGMSISTEVDKVIRKWAAKIDSSIDKLKETSYTIYFENVHVKELEESKFAILDVVREIETEADFPLSLSIGLGVGGKTVAETAEFADAALELALGRGGDQAVVKKKSKIQYFGGKTQTVEKSNKGKSRIVGHALKKLIEQSNRVFIMGHKNADMDAFGSSLGIYRMCLNVNTDANIVIDVVNDSLQAIYKQVKETDNYNIITTAKAKSLIEHNDLVIVVDTHRPSYIEAPEILEMTDRIVVIDHHRRAEESIESPTLSYIETYASSTAELVSEMLQYAGNRKSIIKLEAEALLAGMTIDTNRFAVKTGVRTFEAAAWLRRSGADTTEVKRFFQTDMEAFKVRAKCIAAAKFHENGVATSICEGQNQDAQVINSQVADELLNIKGVKASFVAGQNENGITCISARSLGEMNVQIIVEKLGGGGHLTTAGAQVNESPEEVIETVLDIVGKLYDSKDE